ncbi:unnamed protein product [Calypogeia fissa]
MEAAGKHLVLMFVQQRKETAHSARAIRDTAMASATVSRLLKEDSTKSVKSHDLREALPFGYALHLAEVLGRASRLQIDTHGEGNVITAHSEPKYGGLSFSLMNQQSK